MRIDSLRVDGFGLFSQFQLDDLSPGLTLVVGPNEAGKSTLLDFLRGMLFGFPRRNRIGVHEPLRGGRHGGLLRFVDDEGASWIIERHVTEKSPTITGPDGRTSDAEELRRVLGGADDALFSSVFAFGLTELASFQTLEQDEVREVVFSAGVLGAGRSATRAMRALEGRQLAIVRARQADALANRLRRRLEEVESDLRRTRRSALEYPSLSSRRDEITVELETARTTCEATRARRAELERLAFCRPVVRRRNSAAAALAATSTARGDDVVLGLAATISRLVVGESGHAVQQANFDKLASQLRGIQHRLDELTSLLGIDKERLDAVVIDFGLEERAEAIGAKQHELDLAIGREQEQLASAKSGELEIEDELARLERPDFENESALDNRLRRLRELGRLVNERNERAQHATEAERDAMLRALTGKAVQHEPRARLVVLSILIGALGIGAVLLARNGSLFLGLALVGLGVIAAIVVLLLPFRRPEPEQAASPKDTRPQTGPLLERLDRSIASLAGALGLPGQPTSAEIESAGEQLEVWRSLLRARDELCRRRDEMRRRRHLAEERGNELARAKEELLREAAELALRIGLSSSFGASALASAVKTLRDARELREAEHRVETELDELKNAIFCFEQEVYAAAQATEQFEGASLAECLAGLDRVLAAARERAGRRRELEETIKTATNELKERLGDPSVFPTRWTELEDKSEESLAFECRQLDEEIERAALHIDGLVAAERDAQRELEQVASSIEVAALELEHQGLLASLDAALEQWATFGAARLLIERSLHRYEKENQPKVIAKAADAFSLVTEGRYVGLVAHEDGDGSKRRGIDALARTGERVDSAVLSRGTAEQLYLCLRLAFAVTFPVVLPIVLDDVLVNFDARRRNKMAGAIAEAAKSRQILAFTCHPHVVESFCSVSDEVALIELETDRFS